MPSIDAIGMVARDLPATLAFYRELGIAIPAEADAAPHAEVELAGGVRLMWDTEATIRSFDPDWQRQPGQSHTLALRCDSPAESTRSSSACAGSATPCSASRGTRPGASATPPSSTPTAAASTCTPRSDAALRHAPAQP